MMSKLMISSLTFLLVFFVTASAFALPYNSNRPYSNSLITSSLQGVFDTHTLLADGTSHLDAVNDQSSAAVWNQTDAGVSEYLVRFDGSVNLRSELYIYQYGAEANMYQITDFLTTPNAGFTFSTVAGDLYINGGLIQSGFGDSFGFATMALDNTISYTEDSLNVNNEVRALTYLLDSGDQVLTTYLNGSNWVTSNGGDDWVVAFETTPGYADFDDNIFYIEDMAPVPEPATLLLLGSGLVGLAFLKRRKS